MITTEHINELKIKNRGELYKLLREQKDNGKILFLLEHLGRLPSGFNGECFISCLLYTSPSPRDRTRSRMPSSA